MSIFTICYIILNHSFILRTTPRRIRTSLNAQPRKYNISNITPSRGYHYGYNISIMKNPAWKEINETAGATAAQNKTVLSVDSVSHMLNTYIKEFEDQKIPPRYKPKPIKTVSNPYFDDDHTINITLMSEIAKYNKRYTLLRKLEENTTSIIAKLKLLYIDEWLFDSRYNSNMSSGGLMNDWFNDI